MTHVCMVIQEIDRMGAQDAINQYLDLSAEGARLLGEGVQLHHFSEPGEVIHKGQHVSGAYLVTRGQLRVFTYTPQGSEATLYLLRPGETCVLALNCLFNDLRYPAWVETERDTEVALIPGPLYRRLFERETSVQNLTVKALSSVVFRLMDELEQIHSCTLEQRLAGFLLANASQEGVVAMTQQAIAGHLGTSREVIARLMQGISSRGMVQTSRGRIELLDTQALADLSRPSLD